MSTAIAVKEYNTAEFAMNEDGVFLCTHPDAYIDQTCCSPFQVGESGHVECGCGGVDSVVCPAIDCTGIEDHEVDQLFERLG